MFFQLYRNYYHSLFFLGLKKIKEPGTVKDAIHQLFLYLWEKRATIQQVDNVRAYLLSSLVRMLYTDSKKRNKSSNLEIAWSNSMVAPPPSPEELLIRKESNCQLRHQVAHCLELLPARQKELIVFRVYEGLSCEEIAIKTGLSRRTVYNSIYEAFKKLRQAVEAGADHSFFKSRAYFFLALSTAFLANSCKLLP